MNSSEYNPVDTFFSSAALAEEVGISRAAVSDAVKQGRLRPDALLVSPGKVGVPIFRRSTIEEFKAKRGTRQTSPARRPKSQATNRDLGRIVLTLQQQTLLLEALQQVEEKQLEAIGLVEKLRLPTEVPQERYILVRDICEKLKRDVGRERDVSDVVSIDTLCILMAAVEFSARESDLLAGRLEAKRQFAEIREDLLNLANAKRELFSIKQWQEAPWQRVFEAMGLSEPD